MSLAGLLPVGTILAYACDTFAFLDDSWLPCDGSPYDAAEYPELYQAIGTNYGSPGKDQFNVPQLQGHFLRGCDNGTSRDPRAAARTALMPGGNTGDAVGSFQPYGTGSPQTPFKATFPRCNLRSGTTDSSCASPPGEWNTDETIVSPSTGGDLESRCKNIYVTFVVKALTKTPRGVGTVPIGAIVAYAGFDQKAVDAATWLFCDGASVPNTGPYKDLSNRIDRAFGAPAPTAPPVKPFFLPDLRGQFLRGKDDQSRTDPDASKRTAPRPDQPSAGATGDRVGSVQSHATALPHRPFTSALSNLPADSGRGRVDGSLWDLAGGYDGSTAIDVSASGGDQETRPRNLAVDWFVASRQPDGAAPDDLVPVGAIVAIGVQLLHDNDSFLLCDGRTVSGDTYPELFAQIGLLYGGDPATQQFKLPNCQGLFLRGADHGAGLDPDCATRVFSSAASLHPAAGTAGSFQEYATARPAGSGLQAVVPHIPTRTIGAIGMMNDRQCRVQGDLTTDTCTGGGDGESAPVNVYVQFFIKARS